MTMRLNVACYIFPAFGNQLALRRSFFSLSVSRHPALAHSLRHLARNAGRQRCVPSTSRRRLPCKWQVSAVSVLEEEGDELRELLEFRGSEWDAQEVGTSGKQVRQAPRGQKIQTRAERQQFDWRKGWEDRDAEVDVGRRYGSQGATGGDRFEEKGSARWERSHSGSHASSSTTRRDAFNRFLQRDSRQEAQSSAPADWEPGFYPNDARTASSKISTTSPWSRLSKSLADPPQESVEQGDGRGELKHVSAGTPSNSFPSPLPRLSKFFPDSIINPFSNPPPTSSSRGFFWQSEDKKELAEEGRKLAEDLWGKRSGSQAASRYSSKSVGSRSVPSRPSIPGRFSKYNPNNLRKGRQMHSTSPQPSSQSSVAAKPLLPENTTVVGSTHHKDQGSPALATGVPSPSLEWDSSPDKSCELAPSPSQDSSGSPQLPAPEDDVSAPAKGSKSDVPKVLVETFPPPAPTGLPFEFQYSYSEAPQTPPLKIRNEFSPFGPRTASRPWTGKAPLKKSKKNVPEFDSFNPPPNKKGIKYVQQPGPFPPGQGPKPAKTREEILGEPLTKDEINELVESCIKGDRQINLGRDGLTHNMLDLVHSHWKRRRCIKIKCKGVPTVDMDNVCFHLEDKTGGVIIYRVGGTAYLYRGRYYNYKDRPHIPLMLWKPMAPIYPKLCKPVPDGLTKTEVTELRKRGRRIQPLKKLGKNGVYLNLVQEVRDGFLFDDIVRIDCKGLNPSDYKKIGAKLKDLVPCVILSFEKEQILLWRGRDVEMSESIKHPVPDSSTADTVESDEEEDDEGSSNESVAVSSTEDPVPVSAEDDSFADALQPVAEGQEMMTLVAAEKTMGDEREESVVSVTGAELTGDDGPSTGLPEAEPNNSAPVTDGMSNDDDKARVELQEKNRRRRMNLEDLWERAIESGKALAVEEPEAMDPDAVKEKAAIMAASQKPTTKDEKKEAKGTPKAEVASILEDVSTRVGRLPVDDLVRFL